MEKVTRKTKASGVAQQWLINYRLQNGWEVGDKQGEIYKKLIALGANPEPDDVELVTGHSSWTDCRCNECGECVDEIIIIGEEDSDDYESVTASICKECLIKALKEFTQ